MHLNLISSFFFFNDTATTEIYTLSLHDALPIYVDLGLQADAAHADGLAHFLAVDHEFLRLDQQRSEEHTSELQSHLNLVCRLLLEKKKKNSQRPLDARPSRPTATHLDGARSESS